MIAIVGWLTAIAVGVRHLWHGRYEIIGDGISYLDIGDAFARGDWTLAVSAYWSPLYAWTLGAATALSPFPRESEYLVVAAVNLVAYLFALAMFAALLRELRSDRAARTGEATGWSLLPGSVWLAVCYLVFVWSSTTVSRIWYATPDMLLSGFVCLGTCLVLRARRQPESWRPAFGLGLALGVGYLVKTPMAALAVVYLGCLAVAIGRWKVAAPRVAMATAVAVLIAAPYVVAISAAKGRFTIGESGRLNVAWQMNGVPNRFWQGPPPGYGAPTHPPRRIHTSPDAFEFGRPFAVTYPVWFDPSYWFEGIDPQVSLDRLSAPLHAFARVAEGIVRQQVVFYLALAGLAFISLGQRGWARDVRRLFPLWMPAGAGLAMYSLVWTEPRYIAMCVALLTVALISAVRLPPHGWPGLRRLGTVLAAIMCVSMAVSIAFRLASPPPTVDTVHSSQELAEFLNHRGVSPGDRVAFIRAGGSVYFARLAGVTIVAEISAEDFWRAGPKQRRSVLAAMARAGAEVVVTSTVPPGAEASAVNWQPVPHTTWRVWPLRP